MDALDEALSVAVDFHRDRGDLHSGFNLAYVDPKNSPGSAATRQSFEAAVRVVLTGFPVRDPVGLDEDLLRPDWRDFLASLAPRERQARLEVAGHMQRMAYERHQAAMERVGIPEQSRLAKVYPELCGRVTARDKLLPINSGVELGPTWINYKGHSIHCHPAIHRDLGARRGNAELFSHFNRVMSDSVELALAVDSSRLCPRGELFPILEADRWFGRPYSANTLDDLRVVGRTVFTRSRARGRFVHEREGLLTEVRWTSDGELKAFEIEELPIVEHGRTALCRFVHAIRDTQSQRFIHLDGALHIYSPQDFELRRSQIPTATGKVYGKKTKLFRLDQVGGRGIETQDWASIVQSFFRGNELVLEYFAGVSFDEIYRATYGHEYPYPRTT